MTAYAILFKLYKIDNIQNPKTEDFACANFTMHLYYGLNKDNSPSFEKINIASMYKELKENFEFYQNRWESGYSVKVGDLNISDKLKVEIPDDSPSK
jgi:hypothetical protein